MALPAVKSGCILIVDDNEDNRDLLAALLQRAGHRTLVAGNGRAGLELLRQISCDLILLDLLMPELNGIQTLEILKNDPDLRHIPVIVISGLEQHENLVRCIELGAEDYFFKPFDNTLLNARVCASLEKKQLRDLERGQRQILEQRVRIQTQTIRKSQEEIALRLLTAAAYRDLETGAHVRRIGLYAAEVGRRMGWPEDEVEVIRVAAPMHDIGKIGIPDAILQKPSSLQANEWDVMKRHTLIGHQLLSNSGIALLDYAASIALSHHERWSGTGYPERLGGIQIPMEARIVAVVDVFDALVHNRCYKAAWTEERAAQVLWEERAKQFDPDVVELFLNSLDVIREIRLAYPDPAPEQAMQSASTPAAQ